ncbi:MAG: hypothetical protein Kow0029_19640 [Candidatus Rifleibacteriota bacterium]
MSDQALKRFLTSAISWLGLVFCFFLFPAFVLDTSLDGLLELKAKNNRQRIFAELSQINEKLLPYDDERKYFERLLNRIFTLAKNHRNSLIYLEKSIRNLKKNYPGQIEFVV